MTPRLPIRSGRAQANLPVVAVALVVLTAVTGTAVAMAEGALLSADRDAAERAASVTAADRLVAADSAVTKRANVLDRTAVEELTVSDIERIAPVLASMEYRIRIGNEVVVERGEPTGGTTVRRIGLLASTDDWEESLDTGSDSLTLPRRTAELTVRVDDATVTTVRVDGRVVLHDQDGLSGSTIVDVSRYETVRVTADGDDGRVTIVAAPETTEKTTVVVTVDG